MKLRIRGNSVRLRLTRSDVARLGAEGRVADAVAFGPGSADVLAYVLESSPSADAVTARLTPGTVTVVLPAAIARAWVDSEQVAVAAEQPGVGPGATGVLRILVEKDFVCQHSGGETHDRYPNPALAGGR